MATKKPVESKSLIIRGIRVFRSNPMNPKSSFKICLEVSNGKHTKVGDLVFRRSFDSKSRAERELKKYTMKYPVGDKLTAEWFWGQKKRESIPTCREHYILMDVTKVKD